MQSAEPHYRFVGGAHFAVTRAFRAAMWASWHRRDRWGDLPGLNSEHAARTLQFDNEDSDQPTMPRRNGRISVAQLMVGGVYDIKGSTAAFLIATGCAEPYREPQSNSLPLVSSRGV